jgi:hypothetical protein
VRGNWAGDAGRIAIGGKNGDSWHENAKLCKIADAIILNIPFQHNTSPISPLSDFANLFSDFAQVSGRFTAGLLSRSVTLSWLIIFGAGVAPARKKQARRLHHKEKLPSTFLGRGEV